MAILFVTVLKTEAETAVEAKTFPVAAGNVNVFDPATAGAASVTCPLVSPVKTSELMIFLYKTTQREPVGTVTDWPDATVIGPVDIALLPAVIV
jgi:hypothetical protein